MPKSCPLRGFCSTAVPGKCPRERLWGLAVHLGAVSAHRVEPSRPQAQSWVLCWLIGRNSPRGRGCRVGGGEGRRAERGPWTSGPLLPVTSLCLWGLLRHDHVYTRPADVTVLLHTPSLWLGGSDKDNTQFMTGSSGCMVTCWPCPSVRFL